MNIITLTTDFGTKDWYVGCMKGVIIRINPKATIIDITHDCPAQDISSGGFILSNIEYFPENTIHIAIIDPEVGSARVPLIVRLSNSQIYVLPDNGLLSFLLEKHSIIESYAIENPNYTLANKSSVFHGRDVFAPAAAYASLGIPLNSFGPGALDIKKLDLSGAVIETDRIMAKVIYIDSFGNLITNAHRSKVTRNVNRVLVQGLIVHKISQKYSDAQRSEVIALFNSLDHLEISVNCGSAKETLSAGIGTPVTLILE
jgi:S-adenosyl-L-methionine hydrolase (adenosine-forming)